MPCHYAEPIDSNNNDSATPSFLEAPGQSQRTHSTPSPSALTSPPSSLPPLAFALNLGDIELFHHYTLAAEAALGPSSMWREKVPILSFQHDCVLHLMLAVSGLHLARIHPAESSRFNHLAEHHLTTGIRKASKVVPTPGNDNCAALYITTVLACCSVFAMGPSPGHFLLVAKHGHVAWWGLFRGLRALIETVGFDAIFSGVLRPTEGEEEDAPKGSVVHFPYSSWEANLGTLASLVQSCNSITRQALYQKSLDSLHGCFMETYGPCNAPKAPIVGRLEIIMVWLYRLEDEFVEQIGAGDQVALVILAYFTVLLQMLESLWYVEGWATHIIQEVAECLDASHLEFLDWPKAQIQTGSTVINAFR